MRVRLTWLWGAALAGAVSICAPAGAHAATVVLRPAAAAPGASVALSGSGFKAGARVHVGGRRLATRAVRASSRGTFALRLTVPDRRGTIALRTRAGRTRVVNHLVATAGVPAASVVEAASSARRSLRVSPAAPVPGGTLRLRGDGFPGRARLQLTGLGAARRLRTGADGSFTVRLKVPATLARGRRVIAVSGRHARLRLRLTIGGAAAGTPAGPSATGSSVQGPSGGSVTVTGDARVGAVLTADAGAWAGTAPLALAYQWQRCDAAGGGCAPIDGAGAPTYAVAAADLDHTLRASATATNAAGAVVATSAPTAVVVGAPAVITAPSVSGTAQSGRTLTGNPGAWTGTAPIASTYQWLRCNVSGGACKAISSATKTTYTATSSDVGARLVFQVTAKNRIGTTVAASQPTTVVSAAPLPGSVVAQWHMDERSGSTMLDAVGRHDGRLSSGVTLNQSGGFTGTAYRFDGSTGRVDVPAGDLSPGSKDVAVTVHMKTGLLPPRTVQDWDLFKKGSYASGPEIKVEYYPSGQASCGFSGSSGGVQTYGEIVNVGPKLDDNAWHEVTCVKTSSSIALYVDGKQVSRQTVTIGSITSAEDVVIGAHSAGSEYFDGLIDEVVVRY